MNLFDLPQLLISAHFLDHPLFIVTDCVIPSLLFRDVSKQYTNAFMSSVSGHFSCLAYCKTRPIEGLFFLRQIAHHQVCATVSVGSAHSVSI